MAAKRRPKSLISTQIGNKFLLVNAGFFVRRQKHCASSDKTAKTCSTIYLTAVTIFDALQYSYDIGVYGTDCRVSVSPSVRHGHIVARQCKTKPKLLLITNR